MPFDTAPKQVTLYPGNVARLDWTVTPLFILFARALDSHGAPIANADVNGPHGIGRTDAEGYFQIETRSGERLALSSRAGVPCEMAVGEGRAVDGLVSAGDRNGRGGIRMAGVVKGGPWRDRCGRGDADGAGCGGGARRQPADR